MAAAAIAGKDAVKAGLQFSRVDEVVVNDLVSRWVCEASICSPHCAIRGTKMQVCQEYRVLYRDGAGESR
jgi:hypothetical protein